MKIGIIGGGAIGLLFSHYLSKKFDVTLLVRRNEQLQKVNRLGVTLKREDCSNTAYIHTERLSGSRMEFDLIFVAVKEYNLAPILTTLTETHAHIPLIFLQNGIGHIERVKSLPHHTLLAGSVEHGALRENDHSVIHLGIGKTNLAFIRGKSSSIEELLIQYIENFPILLQDDYEKMMLKKLFVNVLINPLTSIAGVKNGRLPENPHFLHIQHKLFEELQILFPHMKDQIHFQEILDICYSTSANRSSMLKDIEEQRKTEIETILGALLMKAETENHFVPIMKTLYELVKGIEREGQGG
ncbi:2-dehydropantoate 2-reductase [Bacillus sp. Marseille-Q1617]|uniref:2-dehydropantoate 2-reductase n=1 Tax=Bacillus sp. Marseille-Q1617 TaxID=2736887 RepID=UPI00158D6460|nr:2-dehydropantoate 2-reductase [Bacillus sp. Marseille-Q1617]